MTAGAQRLGPGLRALLDGTELASKVGHTLLLTATDQDGWPRTALLSVGEVLAVDDARLRLLTYGSSRTTKAVESSRRGQLLTVLDGAVHKILLDIEAVYHATEGRNLTAFDATIHTVECDEVPYAHVEHGIGFSLADDAAVVARWQEQVSGLRRGGPSHA